MSSIRNMLFGKKQQPLDDQLVEPLIYDPGTERDDVDAAIKLFGVQGIHQDFENVQTANLSREMSAVKKVHEQLNVSDLPLDSNIKSEYDLLTTTLAQLIQNVQAFDNKSNSSAEQFFTIISKAYQDYNQGKIAKNIVITALKQALPHHQVVLDTIKRELTEKKEKLLVLQNQLQALKIKINDFLYRQKLLQIHDNAIKKVAAVKVKIESQMHDWKQSIARQEGKADIIREQLGEESVDLFAGIEKQIEDKKVEILKAVEAKMKGIKAFNSSAEVSQLEIVVNANVQVANDAVAYLEDALAQASKKYLEIIAEANTRAENLARRLSATLSKKQAETSVICAQKEGEFKAFVETLESAIEKARAQINDLNQEMIALYRAVDVERHNADEFTQINAAFQIAERSKWIEIKSMQHNVTATIQYAIHQAKNATLVAESEAAVRIAKGIQTRLNLDDFPGPFIRAASDWFEREKSKLIVLQQEIAARLNAELKPDEFYGSVVADHQRRMSFAVRVHRENLAPSSSMLLKKLLNINSEVHVNLTEIADAVLEMKKKIDDMANTSDILKFAEEKQQVMDMQRSVALAIARLKETALLAEQTKGELEQEKFKLALEKYGHVYDCIKKIIVDNIEKWQQQSYTIFLMLKGAAGSYCVINYNGRSISVHKAIASMYQLIKDFEQTGINTNANGTSSNVQTIENLLTKLSAVAQNQGDNETTKGRFLELIAGLCQCEMSANQDKIYKINEERFESFCAGLNIFADVFLKQSESTAQSSTNQRSNQAVSR